MKDTELHVSYHIKDKRLETKVPISKLGIDTDSFDKSKPDTYSSALFNYLVELHKLPEPEFVSEITPSSNEYYNAMGLTDVSLLDNTGHRCLGLLAHLPKR